MEVLDLITARTGLSLTIEQLKNSLDGVKESQPNRVDMIERMQTAISRLTFSYCFFCELEIEYRISRQRNVDFEFDRINDKAELIHLQQLVEQLKQNI